jgi:ribosome maturation factor RimP
MATVSELTSQLEPLVTALGYEIDDITLRTGRNPVLEIVVDADAPIDMNAIAEVTRAVSGYLDESDVMGERPYLLEVSSRGVTRPLSKPAHWRRNIGRLVEVRGDAVNATGRIVEFANPIVTLDVDGKTKEIDINSISKAEIQVEFKKLDKEEQE